MEAPASAAKAGKRVSRGRGPGMDGGVEKAGAKGKQKIERLVNLPCIRAKLKPNPTRCDYATSFARATSRELRTIHSPDEQQKGQCK